MGAAPVRGRSTEDRVPLHRRPPDSLAVDYQADIADRNIAITAGCNQAFAATMMALAEAGDNVILPVPYYFNHHMWLEMLGIRPRYLPAIKGESTTPAGDTSRLAARPVTRAVTRSIPR